MFSLHYLLGPHPCPCSRAVLWCVCQATDAALVEQREAQESFRARLEEVEKQRDWARRERDSLAKQLDAARNDSKEEVCW